MEAIVKISGKQYRVAEGARLTVDRLATGVGDEVSFGDVLMLTDGARATVGRPTIDGAAVTVRVVAATRGPKLIVYKYKAKKRFRRTQGARAEQSLLEVLTVSGPGSKAKPAKAPATAEPKTDETETEAAKPRARSAKTTAAAEPKAAETETEAAKPAKATATEVAKPAKATAAEDAKPAKAAATAKAKATATQAVKPKATKPQAKRPPQPESE
jgi:large subunit ribosomal protein L21